MAIAIKKLDQQDINAFSAFLETPRKELPALRFSPLVYPHEDLAVMAFKKKQGSLKAFAEKYAFVLTEYDYNIVSLSRHIPVRNADNSRYIFSGYVYYDGKMLIGVEETSDNIDDIRKIKENCGEFCTCVISNGSIKVSSDYFGMVPLFYFDNDEVFIASDNYHLMLLILRELGISLTMNIARSRVNIITSGYLYGSPFSNCLDVDGCKVNHAYEEIQYSMEMGLALPRTSLWNDISRKYEWNEDLYEEYIYSAKKELEEYCKAAFEHPRFDKIVIDLSGGFDSRAVFATACNLPKHLRKKISTYTRRSETTEDDVEKASALTNLYNYPKHTYSNTDRSNVIYNNEINLAHFSRNLGTFSCNIHVYSSVYDDYHTLELTGGIGDAVLGYQRIRGELKYSLGDQRLLARLGGSYLHNEVEELQGVFEDQKRIINETLNEFSFCDCLFKKFHAIYVDMRNRFNFNSSHNVENNNMRIPMMPSKYALKAKWMYFSCFSDNKIPDEKISLDLITAINPLIASLPFASNNDNVIPKPENLLNPVKVRIEPDSTFKSCPEPNASPYTDKVLQYIGDLENAEQMLLHIYDYSKEYYPVCLGLYKVISMLKESPDDARTHHARETIRKIYDVYYQIRLIERD